MSLKGKTALVTGSTSGIGLGMAKGLAEAGADVALNSHENPADIEPIRKKLADETGRKVIFLQADMSNADAIAAMCKRAETELGKVDIVVNNAGIQHVAPVHEFPLDKWNLIIAINLNSAFHTSRALLPGMKARKWGRIINLASAHGLIGSPFKSAYVAAKHGMVGLTKVTALEVAEEGITCNAICPGYVLTPLVEKQIADQAKVHNLPPGRVIKEVMLKGQPTRKFVGTDEIAGLAVFLCTDAAQSITGTALPIDGGWVAQ
ncbi:MAG: 3-hydroxybutyrate dehydrogenase [Alphaproteobacteria bacterium]|nr:3-hydroxybutyrate dehydrogenase [Alphaproteobacteria bacterium]